MNTDRLIEILSAGAEPVKGSPLGRLLLLSIVASGAIAFGLMLATVGPRPDLHSSAHLEWVLIKLLFAVSVIVAAAPLLNRSIHPGLEKQTKWGSLFVPFLAAIATGLVILLLGEPHARGAMLRGATTVSPLRCLSFIMFFAAIPLAAIIWVVRKGAPTRLKLSGGIAGIVAGGIGAAAYAVNCSSDTIPFIAIWYGTAIGLCAVAGAQLGPRVLRW